MIKYKLSFIKFKTYPKSDVEGENISVFLKSTPPLKSKLKKKSAQNYAYKCNCNYYKILQENFYKFFIAIIWFMKGQPVPSVYEWRNPIGEIPVLKNPEFCYIRRWCNTL